MSVELPAVAPAYQNVIYITAETEAEVLSVYNGALLADATHSLTKQKVVVRKRRHKKDGVAGFIRFSDDHDYARAMARLPTLQKPADCIIGALTVDKTSLCHSFDLSFPLHAIFQASRGPSPLANNNAEVVRFERDDDDEDRHSASGDELSDDDAAARRGFDGRAVQWHGKDQKADTIEKLKALGREFTLLMKEKARELRTAKLNTKKAEATHAERRKHVDSATKKITSDADATLIRIRTHNALESEHEARLEAGIPEAKELLAKLNAI